jgi:hypothetical protein
MLYLCMIARRAVWQQWPPTAGRVRKTACSPYCRLRAVLQNGFVVFWVLFLGFKIGNLRASLQV